MKFNNNLAQNNSESEREDWANRNEQNYINPIDQNIKELLRRKFRNTRKF